MSEQCRRCGRPILSPLGTCENEHRPPVRCAVKHDYYGCNTGCCGHSVYGYDEEGRTVFRRFEFTHPSFLGAEPETRKWAEDLAREHLPGVPLDFDACELSDD